MLNYGKRAFFATFKSIYVDNGSSFFDSVKSGSFLDQALSYGYIKIDPGSPPPNHFKGERVGVKNEVSCDSENSNSCYFRNSLRKQKETSLVVMQWHFKYGT